MAKSPTRHVNPFLPSCRPPFPADQSEHAPQNRERIKYAKWKATDIAKAFREGRKPTPGPAGGLQEGEEDAADPSKVTADEAKELSKEFEALDTRTEPATSAEPARKEGTDSSGSGNVATPAAAADDATTYAFPQQPTTLPSAPSAEDVPDFVDEDELPDFGTADADQEEPLTAPDPLADTPTATLSPPAPESHQTSELPEPHAHRPSEPPAFPSAVFPSAPALPPHPPSFFHAPPAAVAGTPPSFKSPPASTAAAPPPHPSPPPIAARPTAPAPPPPPPRTVEAKTDNFDPVTVAQVQKHAKWAISALNYDDFETARKELRLALAMLGG